MVRSICSNLLLSTGATYSCWVSATQEHCDKELYFINWCGVCTTLIHGMVNNLCLSRFLQERINFIPLFFPSIELCILFFH